MRKQSIGVRLGVVFTFLIAVLTGVGWLGLSRMARIDADMEQVVNSRWDKLRLSSEALNYSTLNHGITMEIFLLRERGEIGPLLARRAENSQKITGLIEKLEGGVESGRVATINLSEKLKLQGVCVRRRELIKFSVLFDCVYDAPVCQARH